MVERLGDRRAGLILITLASLTWGTIGIAVSLLIPSDGLWRAASYYLQSPGMLAGVAARGSLPFASVTPPATPFLVWAAGYALVCLTASTLVFSRRDL